MMKRLFAAIALMACLAVSCQKNEEELPIFEARTESGSAKTELVGSIIQWVSGDQVKVFGDFGYAIYNVTPRSGDPTWATLTPSENHGLTGLLPYRFVYPATMASGGATTSDNNNTLYVTYPSERSIDDGALKYYPMYGVSGNNDVQFRNLGGIVKITLPEMDSVITYIVIAADESITGKYSFTSDCSSMSHVDEGNPDTSITINVNGQATELYVAVPNGDYHNFAIEIYTNGGYVARKVGSCVNVGRSKISTIAVSNLVFTGGNHIIPTLAEKAFYAFAVSKPIVFHYNWNEYVVGGTRIDNLQTVTPIWMKTNSNSVDIYTHASQIYAPANCDSLFYNCMADAIDFGNGFNTSNVTSMRCMFRSCGNLSSLDLSSFNTSNVTDMSNMFSNWRYILNLNLSSFNTSNVTDMSNMFSDCLYLTSLDLSSFNTSNVTDMSCMFANIQYLTSLDLSSFNTLNVTSMRGMFGSCRNLTSLNLSSFNTSNVTSMRAMFDGCEALTSLDLSSFSSSNLTNVDYMFELCCSLSSIEFSSNFTINSSCSINYTLDLLGCYTTNGCTIHCNETTKNRLMNPSSGYSEDVSNVFFNTVY